MIFPERYDAFFSYARDDNVLNDDAVRLFRTYLKLKFEAEFGRRNKLPREIEAEIFMDDEGLPANGDLTDELKIAIEQSVFLVIFIGKWYPDSEWCGKELEIFSKQFLTGERRNALERTFLIVLDKNAVRKSWGDYLDEPDRPIFERLYDEITGRPIPLVLEGPDGQAVQSPRFSKRLRHVVDTMVDRALKLQSSREE